jgi:hypothetical protein
MINLPYKLKESFPSQSLGAIWRYRFLNRVIIGLRVFSDLESVVSNMEVGVPEDMASTYSK